MAARRALDLGHDDAQGIMAKVMRAWAPLAVALPALYAIGTGLAALAAASPALASYAPAAAAAMGWPTAIGMIVCGTGLLSGSVEIGRGKALRLACGAVLAAIGIAGAIANASDMAGTRMSPPTAAAFVLTALLLCTYDRPRDRGQALLVQVLVGGLLMLALVSIITMEARVEGLMPWYRFSRRMLPATAGGFVAIGIALLALVARSRWYETLYANREDEKILLLAMGILSLVAISMGAAAFVAMQQNLERALRATLAQGVVDRAAILDTYLANRISRAGIVASRPSLVAALREAPRASEAARKRVQDEAASYLGSGFNGVRIRDASGAIAGDAGAIDADPPLEVRLEGQRAAAILAWDGAYRLGASMPVLDGSRIVGTVETEQELELVDGLQANVSQLGRTAEWVLCGTSGERMACFPSRFEPRAEVIERRRDGESLPMALALDLGRGVVLAPDYRGDRVIAGYAPVGATGLGVVLKMRLEEFYQPLRDQMGAWWRWYFAVVIVGALLVASQVRPVAQRLVRSEAMAKERAEELGRSEGALRALYAALGDGIVVLTPEGRIEFVNPAAERIFGYAPGELLGEPIASLIPEEMRESNAAATRRFIEQGTSNVVGRGSFVFPAVRRDGTRFDVEFSLAPLRQGEELRLVAVIRDVSERTALERLKREFIGTVSHELRTPLTSMIGSLELLREETPLEGEAHELVDMAWRNSQRLAVLVNDVLDSERIESGAMRFECVPFGLAAFVHEAVGLNRAYASRYRVELLVDDPLPEASILGDRERLMQVMANLLSNAAKFSPRGAQVVVRAAIDGRKARIEVTDRGRGIPEAFRARVFEKFAQADAGDAREKGGTGLGLSICKAIVERLGGAIGFEDRPGGGATFWFEVPLSA
jgi:PAS domain S-box-containing protein